MQVNFDFSMAKPSTNYSPSQQAYQKVSKDKLLLQQAVLDSLRDFGPQTTEEISATTGIEERSIQPRTSELKKEGKIFVGENRAKNSRGNSVSIWHLPSQMPKTKEQFREVLVDFMGADKK